MIEINDRIQNIYRAMLGRCDSKTSTGNYKRFGIEVCDEWKNDYESFEKWAISNGYSDELCIDRINTYKGYTPENCRWTTLKENSRNRTNTIFVECKGEVRKLCELCEEHGMRESVVYSRLRLGWNLEKALTMPIRPRTGTRIGYTEHRRRGVKIPNSIPYHEVIASKNQ